MVDEQTEQMPSFDSEQSAPSTEDYVSLADSEGSAVADPGEGAVAESPPIDWTRPDDVRRVLDDPSFKGLRDIMEETRLNTENTVRQRLESEFRRQAASDQAVSATMRSLASEMGVADDDESLQRYANAVIYPHKVQAHIDTAKSWLYQAADAAGDEYKQAIHWKIESTNDNPQKLTDLVTEVQGFLTQRAANESLNGFKKSLSEMKPEDLRKDAELTAAFQRWQEAEDRSESRARAQEENRVDPGPNTVGRPVGSVKQYNLNDPIELIAAKNAGQISEDEARTRLSALWR